MINKMARCLCFLILNVTTSVYAQPHVAEDYSKALNIKKIDPIIIEMFGYARAHDYSKLEQMRGEVTKQDLRLSAAYALALYISSPTKYSTEYVDSFPATRTGLAYLYDIENAGLTPKYQYAIDAIGEIANSGNLKAIKKTLIAILNSDAGAAELLCDSFETLLLSQQRKTIRVMSEFDREARGKIYQCFELMSRPTIETIKRNVRSSKIGAKEKKVASEILGQ